MINEKEIDALLHHEYVIANNVHFIPYNSCVKDVGWGCAWRAIQTYLSCNGITVSFEKLVNEFARKDDLLKAIKQTNVIDAKVV